MTFTLPVRYYRNFVDQDKPNAEEYLEFEHSEFELPPEQTALLLVDCWDNHHLTESIDRMDAVVQERIGPVLDAARQSKMSVIHCPSPGVAETYREWTRYADETDLGMVDDSGEDDGIDWPPRAFRDATSYWMSAHGNLDDDNEYREYAKHPEPRANPIDLSIHPRLEFSPAHDEFVVANADQLHRLLAHQEILHLLFVGFFTNVCVRNRDYGIEAMSQRGYNTILLRDCTTAIESHDTVDKELHKKIAIREMETLYAWSATSTDILDALDTPGDERADRP